MPPEGWHEENVPWPEDTVYPLCFGKVWKSLQLWFLDVHWRHHHRGAFEEGVPVKFASRGREAENGLWDVSFIEVLIVVRVKQSEVLLS